MDEGFDHYSNPYDRHRNIFLPGKIIASLTRKAAEESSTGNATVNELSQWVESVQNEHIMFWIHFIDPHWPYLKVDNLKTFYDGISQDYIYSGEKSPQEIRRTSHLLSKKEMDTIKWLYNGEVKSTDNLMSRVFDILSESGRYDDATVVLFSDHGEEFWEHGGFEHGHSQYDEVIRIPLIIKFPNNTHAGTRVNQSVSILDIMPTLLELENISFDGDMQGHSLLPLIRKAVVESAPCFSEFLARGYEKKAVIWGPEKLILDSISGKTEYYDLISDPEEETNLSTAEPEKAETLKRVLNEWHDDCALLNKKIIGEHQEKSSPLDPTVREGLRALGYM